MMSGQQPVRAQSLTPVKHQITLSGRADIARKEKAESSQIHLEYAGGVVGAESGTIDT